ncbi:MAG: type II toxin-antitoxin system VapC family toxin [Gammaproteobacteria bacterium]|nr:type II toxin-antitoxin system VapC family toxin [Gammaproteobacteria bacterium]
MKIIADTNVLIRGVVQDDARQAAAAARALRKATLIAVAIPVLCEYVWVLRRVYGMTAAQIAASVRTLLDTSKLVVNRPAAEAGLTVLEAGGDFADGAIAYEGSWLGGECLVSFDRNAVAVLSRQGQRAIELTG